MSPTDLQQYIPSSLRRADDGTIVVRLGGSLPDAGEILGRAERLLPRRRRPTLTDRLIGAATHPATLAAAAAVGVGIGVWALSRRARVRKAIETAIRPEQPAAPETSPEPPVAAADSQQ